MKKHALTAIAIVLMMTSTISKANETNDKQTYQAIKELLDKKLIDVETAQSLWYKYKNNK